MKNLIKQHNSKILNKTPNQQQEPGNCKCKESCPIKGNCQAQNIVCKATVATLKNLRIYYGTSEGEFKVQFNNHESAFQKWRNVNKTELLKYIWQLNENHIAFILEWDIAV